MVSEILQENHYYPFGLNMDGPWAAQYKLEETDQNGNGTLDPVLDEEGNPVVDQEKLNRYQYNGKELTEDLGLNWNDYGARWYDPAIAKWNAVDPLADIAPDKTPYHFVSNNPINRIDPDGLTDFTLNRKTGEVTQVGEANDEPDRILKTNRKGEVKYNGKDEAKVAIDDIEQGVLANGQNWKTDNQHIDVGGEGQPSKEGVQSFALDLSEYIGKELKGFSYSSDGSGTITDMTIGKYGNNTYTSSTATVSTLIDKYGSSYSNENIFEVFHTHPDGKLGATQSHPQMSADVQNLQRNKPTITNAIFYIIYRIQGQTKPEIYDYTNQYVEPKKKGKK